MHKEDSFKDGECTHQDTYIAVLEVSHTCETTAEKCMYCGKLLTEPKTDCR